MTETTQTERQRILNVGCAPNGRDMRRLAADVEECADRLQRAEELLERCKPAVKGYGWRFHQVGQHTIGDEWWGLEDEINAFLGGRNDRD